MKEISSAKSPHWNRGSSLSPNQSSNKDLEKQLVGTNKQKKTVLQTIGTSGGGSDHEQSVNDPYARTHQHGSQFGQSERLHSKYLSTLKEGNQRLNIIANPVLRGGPTPVAAETTGGFTRTNDG